MAELQQETEKLYRKARTARFHLLLSGPHDRGPAFLEVHAGAGGTESQDWVSMLVRMYMLWAHNQGFETVCQAETAGEEAGLKSITFRIEGPWAYGWLKSETGVHRLVRLSPFDSQKRRHTSFASVGVYPALDETVEVDIRESDLRIDTYRASGAGGQHVNRTDSAVRITHGPSGVVVQCQQSRSQHKNKASALRMLKSRLYEIEEKKKQEEQQQEHASKTDIGWGHQIRSYVLHPYQIVKDLRSGFEHPAPRQVLDGDLFILMKPYLEWLAVQPTARKASRAATSDDTASGG